MSVPLDYGKVIKANMERNGLNKKGKLCQCITVQLSPHTLNLTGREGIFICDLMASC